MFILLTLLLIPLSAVTGGYLGFRSAAKNIQPHEDWRLLGTPPAQVVQILGFCAHQICVQTDDGKRYLYNLIECDQSADQNCWKEVSNVQIELAIPHLSNPCMYEFQFPSPPPDTIQMLGVKGCGSGGDYYESYALLEDGSVWKWADSIGDLAPLGIVDGVIFGVSLGLIGGLLAVIAVFALGRAHIGRFAPTIEEAD
jgi:hypothetical protein